MFHPLDLVAPVGVAILATVLCVFGVIKAKKTLPKIVCVITALMFIGVTVGWYIFRWQAHKCDYETVDGLKVRQGDKNKCDREWVEEHTKTLRTFWSNHCPYEKVLISLGGKMLVCLDSEKLNAMGRHARGYVFGDVAVIGWNGDLAYSESLLKHELSHIILRESCTNKVVFEERAHHAFFKEKGLGH